MFHMPSLFLLRHGKTLWTEEKRFAGWGNAPLSERGLDEALSAARTLKTSSATFDMCFTSCLERAKHTAQIINDELLMPVGDIQYRWRLNERHYGALQGELRRDMVEKHGSSDVMKWRSSYHDTPPKLSGDDPRWQEQLDRLPEVPVDQHPRSESMSEAARRTLPLWRDEIKPALRAGKNILIIAHTNSIRSIIRDIEGFNDAQSAAFRISTAVPRHYEFNEDLKPIKVTDLTRGTKARIHQWARQRQMKWLSKS